MATTVTVHTVTRAGYFFIDAAGTHDHGVVGADPTGNNWVNTGQEYVVFFKSGTGVCNVTLVAQTAPDGLAVTNKVVDLHAPNDTAIVGPFPPGTYNDTNGRMNVTYDDATGVSMMVVKCPPT